MIAHSYQTTEGRIRGVIGILKTKFEKENKKLKGYAFSHVLVILTGQATVLLNVVVKSHNFVLWLKFSFL